ncbi:VCBS repeat-containing protein, partial [bacterium]|nr:VCBS repeat-containing protein [bacterium]
MYSGHIFPILFLIVLLSGCSSTGSDDAVREQPYFLGRIAVIGAHGMAVADFNEDGNLDLAVTINEGDTIGIYLNQGRGWLVPAPSLSAQRNPCFVTTGDFNHDGHIDLVNSNWGGHTVSVFFGDGTGNFGEPTYYGPNHMVGQIEVRDFNNDGHPDFMTSNMGTEDLSLFLNDGQGVFSSNIALTGFSSATKFSSADFNKDGIVDVAVLDQYTVKIFYNNGKGVFGKGRTMYQVNDPMQLKSIDTGDLNSDGIPDVA